MKIAVHCLVKNEDRFLWYAVMSVISHVDRVLIWDTGSTDRTRELIELIERLSDKVETNFLGEISSIEFPEVRQAMLEETHEDWFLVVDGDEIWWDESIRKIRSVIYDQESKLESIVVPTVNLVGDIYHYQEEAAGLYYLVGRKGHLSLRAVNRKIPGLSSSNPHGIWGWTDKSGNMIQDRSQDKILFIDAPYLHASFLQRSSHKEADRSVPKRAKKLKHELGISFSPDFFYPEVFFRDRPEVVDSVWEKIDKKFLARSFFETPLRKMKRRLLPAKIGY